MTETILVITNFPDNNSAQELAKALIEKRLAACVNIMGACTSVYRWQDKIETDQEIPVFIKTQSKHYRQVEVLVNNMHPYELPEIIIVPINGGLNSYLQWIIEETT